MFILIGLMWVIFANKDREETIYHYLSKVYISMSFGLLHCYFGSPCCWLRAWIQWDWNCRLSATTWINLWYIYIYILDLQDLILKVWYIYNSHISSYTYIYNIVLITYRIIFNVRYFEFLSKLCGSSVACRCTHFRCTSEGTLASGLVGSCGVGSMPSLGLGELNLPLI